MSTEQIHEEMTEVSKRGGGLAVLARSVDSLNVTLAHHVAWTEERFDRVDARFDQVDARFEQIDARFEQIDVRFDRVEARLSGIETGQSLVFNELGKISARMEEVLSFAIRDELKVNEIRE